MKKSTTVSPDTALAAHDQVICTLFEKDYHLGVAVLINSIVKSGFRGLFWVGYRGDLPPWTTQLSRREDRLFSVGDALLGFEEIQSPLHFTHYKPDFMNSILERGMVGERLWYFDPDITVRCQWSFFERWVRFGVCLCQEITLGLMPSNDPIRCEWIEAARSAGWGDPVRQQERYYNGGCVGLSLEHRGFLNKWCAANQLAAMAGVDQTQFQTGSRANTFQFADQDALNIASMYCDEPLTTIGPEGMGFINGGFTMYHTVGGIKPWRKKFLRAALDGNPPWNGDKHFLDCADGPIQPFTAGRLKSLRRSAKLASLIGRVYRRS